MWINKLLTCSLTCTQNSNMIMVNNANVEQFNCFRIINISTKHVYIQNILTIVLEILTFITKVHFLHLYPFKFSATILFFDIS